MKSNKQLYKTYVNWNRYYEEQYQERIAPNIDYYSEVLDLDRRILSVESISFDEARDLSKRNQSYILRVWLLIKAMIISHLLHDSIR